MGKSRIDACRGLRATSIAPRTNSCLQEVDGQMTVGLDALARDLSPLSQFELLPPNFFDRGVSCLVQPLWEFSGTGPVFVSGLQVFAAIHPGSGKLYIVIHES
jgi:hypothetical protein